jgi:hypothetical protein
MGPNGSRERKGDHVTGDQNDQWDDQSSYEETLAARAAAQQADATASEAAVLAATAEQHIAAAARLSARAVSSDREAAKQLRIQTQLLWALVKRDD